MENEQGVAGSDRGGDGKNSKQGESLSFSLVEMSRSHFEGVEKTED